MTIHADCVIVKDIFFTLAIALCLYTISICFANAREQILFPYVYKTYAYSKKTQRNVHLLLTLYGVMQ